MTSSSGHGAEGVFVGDIVAGVMSALERTPAHGYRIWNLGSDTPMTLTEMIRTVERVVGRAAIIERRPSQPGDVERTWADLTRARSELGFTPRTSFEAGVRTQWEWARSLR